MSEIAFKPIGQIKAQFSDADIRAEGRLCERIVSMVSGRPALFPRMSCSLGVRAHGR